MAKKKIAGKERPYTFSEFFNIIEESVKDAAESCELDYFQAYSLDRDKTIDNADFTLVSTTTFGGNEGIYTDFDMRCADGNTIHFATAKTLWENEEYFVRMHILGAKFCLAAKKFIRENMEDFNWSGYDVGHMVDGKFNAHWLCYKLDNARARAHEMRKQTTEKIYIRDNATRKVTEYK